MRSEHEGQSRSTASVRGSERRLLLEADGDERDREQIGRQPHVGISRAEHDPRQQHEDARRGTGTRRRGCANRSSACRRSTRAGSARRQLKRGQVEPFPAVAQRHDQPVILARPVEPVGGLARRRRCARPASARPAAPAPGSGGRRGSRPGEKDAAAVVLADQLGRESEHAQRPPAEGVDEPQDERDRHEQGGAQPDRSSRAEPAATGRRRCSASAIDSAKLTKPNRNGIVVGERQREQRASAAPGRAPRTRPRAGRRRSAAGWRGRSA